VREKAFSRPRRQKKIFKKFMEIEIILLFLAGAVGALAKDILADNKLRLPKIADGDFDLGFLGGVVLGGLAGYFIDGSPVTAFMGGLTGRTLAEGLLPAKNTQIISITKLNEAIIREVAKKECVDPDLAVRVAKCESSLNEKAVNKNSDGSLDRGLFQINNKYHPEVTDAEAFNPVLAAEFFCKAVNAGHSDWWKATESCWNK